MRSLGDLCRVRRSSQVGSFVNPIEEGWRKTLGDAEPGDGPRQIHGDALGIIDWLEKRVVEARLVDDLKRLKGHSSGPPGRIFYVEDEPTPQEVVLTLLEGIGELSSAESLREADRLLTSEDFGLVILDIGLPDGSGLELLPRLRDSHGAAIPVVIYTARDLGGGLSHRVDAILQKTSTTNERLLGVIRSLLDRHRPPIEAPVAQEVGT